MKIILSKKYILTMYDYLFHYCQIPEVTAIQYENIPHERICEFIQDTRISRFPIQYYIEEFSLLGLVLCVKDRSGKCLFYINPNLLQNHTKEEIIYRIIHQKDIQTLQEELWSMTVPIMPVSKIPIYSHNTRKKSHQKIIDQKRKERFI